MPALLRQRLFKTKIGEKSHVCWDIDFGRFLEGFWEGFGRPTFLTFAFFSMIFRSKFRGPFRKAKKSKKEVPGGNFGTARRYNAATSACEKGKQWQHALAVMKAIRVDRAWASRASLLGEGELYQIVSATHHCFVLVIDLLLGCGTWDDLMDREFNQLLYSMALRCL